MNGVFGYAALEAKVNPTTLAVDGIPLEEQSKEQLVDLLRSKLSKGAFNKLEKDKPFEKRSQGDVLQIVNERVVRYEVVQVWDLWTSLTKTSEIKSIVATEFPETELKFISWLTVDFVTRPQSSEAITTGAHCHPRFFVDNSLHDPLRFSDRGRRGDLSRRICKR